MSLVKGDVNKVVESLKSRIGKNTYTQGPRRNDVGSGFGDCSGSVRWAYKQIGVEVGGFTGDQIKRGDIVDRGPIMGGTVDINNLKPGDLIFYKGSEKPSDFRPYGVGHVEMYIGDGKVCGHGGGIGPTVKNMTTYMRNRYIMAKRYVEANTSITTPIAQADINIAVSSHMIENVDRLVSAAVISSPEYWKRKLMVSTTVGDAFAILKNVYKKFNINCIEVEHEGDYKVKAIKSLYDNKIINSPDQWIKNINTSMPIWGLMVILMNIHRSIFPEYMVIDTTDYKLNGIIYNSVHNIINNPLIWIKKTNEGILNWEMLTVINDFSTVTLKELERKSF